MADELVNAHDRGTPAAPCPRARRSSRPPSRPAFWFRTTATTRRCPSPAVCRMCLVEVEKAPKLAPACVTAVAEGQVVHVNSEKAQEGARGRARVPADQPPARLPDLRPGRRVRAAGLRLPGRPRGHPLRASTPSATTRWRTSGPTSSTWPTGAFSAPAACASWTTWPRRRCSTCRERGDRAFIGIFDGAAARPSVGRQRGRSLPGGLAALQGLPAQGARLGSRQDRERLPGLHAGLQHHHRHARRRRRAASGRGPTSRSIATSSATTAG